MTYGAVIEELEEAYREMLRAGKHCMRCLDKQLMSRGDKQTLAKCSTARFSVKADLKAINETYTRNEDGDDRSRV
eukprot:scaffold5011_cov164-Skeletonema_dohrnii-CCMP3373.AAC.1